MKNIIAILCLLFATHGLAQEFEDTDTSQSDDGDSASTLKSNNSAIFELGSGLNFSLEDNQYQFNIGGFIQPAVQYYKMEDLDAENEMNIRRAYFSVSGKAVKEKVGFMIQTDFSLNNPLLDAYVSYYPTEAIEISAGQRRTFTNNKEMTIDENQFQFTERSFLSTELTNTGREFGLFASGEFMLGSIGFVPQLAITSGDGRNSFGENSRDADYGGLKYGGRLDVYPLGFFSPGNERSLADLLHESQPKVALGIASSYNSGVSNSVGEGHGNFLMYESEAKTALPDYQKIYADILFKYQGFSLLGEYANSSATNLEGLYTNSAATTALQPQEISSFLRLGNVYNVQLGYVTLTGFGIDGRYSQFNPEFDNYASSLMQDYSAYTLGLTKYFKGNNLKLQAAFTKLNYADNDATLAELLFQIVF